MEIKLFEAGAVAAVAEPERELLTSVSAFVALRQQT